MNKTQFMNAGRKHKMFLMSALILFLLLLIQYTRKSWPFFLDEKGQMISAPASMDESQTRNGSNQHARAPVDIDISQLERFGIQIEEVKLDTIAEPFRAVATVVPDESRISLIHTRVSGWLEQLYINKTGQPVQAGSALAGIFSQELFAAQMEYLAVLKAAQSGPKSLVVESARTRLNVFGMTTPQIRELERRGTANRLVTIVAPRSGIVLDLNAFAGMAVDPSLDLMTIADLSRVWIIAELSGAEETDIRVGTPVITDISASGRGPIQSRVDFIYPALTEGTRTMRVRISVTNPDNQLKPGAYGTAEFRVRPRKVLTVSRDAVVETGVGRHVFVLDSSGILVPRPVQLGVQLPERVEVLRGLSEGEKVVASGVFLIDSESRLRASGTTGGGHGGHGTQESTPKREPEPQPEPKIPQGGGHQGHGG